MVPSGFGMCQSDCPCPCVPWQTAQIEANISCPDRAAGGSSGGCVGVGVLWGGDAHAATEIAASDARTIAHIRQEYRQA